MILQSLLIDIGSVDHGVSSDISPSDARLILSPNIFLGDNVADFSDSQSIFCGWVI